MKKLLMACMLLGGVLAFAPSAFSQEHQHGNGQGQHGNGNGQNGGGREMDYDKLKTDLSLTDAQVSSMKDLDSQYKTKMETLRKDTSLSEEDKKTKMQELRKSKEADLKKILSEEQYQKLTSRGPKGGK
jgi:Spy/CpxP family protein refolding chaperone